MTNTKQLEDGSAYKKFNAARELMFWGIGPVNPFSESFLFRKHRALLVMIT